MIVVGAEGKIDVEKALQKLDEFCIENNIRAQILDASLVYGKEHIEVAYEHAKRAFEKKRNVCNTIEMEMLLYASAKKQIKDAISFIGAKEKGWYAFVFIGKINKNKVEKFVKSLGLKINEKVLHGKKEKLIKFGISEKELKTVDKSMYGELVLEKMALLNAIK
ncbi:hypothetical protein B6U81_04590 [Thermoplasmatales archaeon ex4484_30]|nr:MAG: hypothetical protein FE041_05390 [Thermoplasmata archaeon]OYT60638.1 MAG: hypothetical protein B6U81_04590 [Thermoplasmatales archaeon ex4484_30]